MKSQSVLVIDDSPPIHTLLEARLRGEAIVLHHCLEASEGLEKARALRPDLILLDVDLPGMSGFEVCKALKDDPATAPLPVIFLTGESETSAKVLGFEMGAVDYITKPFEPAELRARVRASLRTKRYQDILETKLHIDGLTTLYNRAYFDRRLSEEIAATRRYGRLVSLAMLDVDHFKTINDAQGHPFGDAVLQRIAESVGEGLRATDAACRFGGDEFALILPEVGLSGAHTVAARIRDKLAKLAILRDGAPLKITASIGLASTESFAHRSTLAPEELVAHADRALYAAKRGGRDCIRAGPG